MVNPDWRGIMEPGVKRTVILLVAVAVLLYLGFIWMAVTGRLAP